MKKQTITLIIILSILAIAFYINFGLLDYEKIKLSAFKDLCYEEQCSIDLCTPQFGVLLKNINLNCKLAPEKCVCSVNNFDSFYLGLGSTYYNPTANLYKSYNDLAKFIDVDKPKMNANFIEGKMQFYSEGVINVWPNDKYGQYHESIHFFLRYYTKPQDGWYPYLEEGVAHYGAYCYNNPDTVRCNSDLGNYKDSDICTPDTGNCKGQVKDTSLVLQLRQDYNCDWFHCWKEFLHWAVTEKANQPLTLRDATAKLNQLTRKDITPLLEDYNVKEAEYPSFIITQEDSVEEEEIINEKGEFTTL